MYISSITLRCIRIGYKKSANRQWIEIRIFVTGATGQLGHDVVNDAVGRGHECIESDIRAIVASRMTVR